MSPIKRYRLLKDTIWLSLQCHHCFGSPDFACVLACGEVCEYFAHTDTYVFDSQDGVCPFYSRSIVEKLVQEGWFEPIENCPDDPSSR